MCISITYLFISLYFSDLQEFKEILTMQKHMSKSEVRCASLMNNILNENINVNEILEKIKLFESNVSYYIIYLFNKYI